MANRRCKNCRFCEYHVSDIKNPAIIRMMNLPTSKHGKAHACVMRLREVKNAEGKMVKVPSIDPADPAGPYYGQRVGPNFVCGNFVGKDEPHESGPQTIELEARRLRHPLDGLGVSAELAVAKDLEKVS